MKKQILILMVLSALFNFSCEKKGGNSSNGESVNVEYVCNCKQIEKVSDFIQKSIRNANNTNNKEMEYVIDVLHRTAVKVNCDRKNIKAIRNSRGQITQLTQKLDSCDRIMENIY